MVSPRSSHKYSELSLAGPPWKTLGCCVVIATVMAVSVPTSDSTHEPAEMKFCHVTDFTIQETSYDPVPTVTPPLHVTSSMDLGQPFLVRGVSGEWPASQRWSHAHFQQLFKGHDLFSSTFSTTDSPTFDLDYPNKEVYYGIFLNNHSLASLVANDYQYPDFIPDHLRLHGME